MKNSIVPLFMLDELAKANVKGVKKTIKVTKRLAKKRDGERKK